MKLEEANAKLSFDIAAGEDDMVLALVESYTNNSTDDFIYKNRTILKRMSPHRIDQFFKIIGEAKRFELQDLHEAFKKNYSSF